MTEQSGGSSRPSSLHERAARVKAEEDERLVDGYVRNLARSQADFGRSLRSCLPGIEFSEGDLLTENVLASSCSVTAEDMHIVIDGVLFRGHRRYKGSGSWETSWTANGRPFHGWARLHEALHPVAATVQSLRKKATRWGVARRGASS